jgi:methanogenic corrinoid protein MtbC1
MGHFTIKDIENLSGIKAHTIRIWEQRYSFLKPQRTDTNIRYYCGDELKNILNVSLLNKYGYKISSICSMSQEEISQKISEIEDEAMHNEYLINEMIKKMIDLDMHSFEKIIDDHLAKWGMDKSVMQLIIPFMEKVGLLWYSGHIKPVQEHLVNTLIRQKLISCIEGTIAVEKLDKTFLLFLPEGERHEMGLLCIYYLLKTRGAGIIYLGANVPTKDLDYIVSEKKPDFIYTHLTSPAPNFNFERFLKTLSAIPSASSLVSGAITQDYKKKLPGNVQLQSTLAEVLEYVSNL